MTADEWRRQKLRRIGAETFDVLVIGGGINGTGIAREAALRGLRTVLVEKGDFANGTSSRSSKLIHGGFRYLETGDFALVFEASRERDLLRRRLAPHLVTPLRFFFPVYRGNPMALWKLRVGLALYDVLAAFRNIERHRGVGRGKRADVEPQLRDEGFLGGALYYDCFTDDARLVLENALGAEEAGAICLNYAAVEALDKDAAGLLDGARVRDLDGETGVVHVRTRSVVNAAGPWLDQVRMLDDGDARPVLRPTKGVHLVVPRHRIGNRNAIVLRAVRDGRILFVIPWDDHTIVGTTDTDYSGPPDAVRAEAEDVDYLLESLNFYFPAARLTERDVVSTFAGLRPLVAGTRPEAPSEISREDELFESSSGLISLGGGKLTTYRRVAIKVIDRVARQLRERFGMRIRARSGTESLPLPGGREPGEPASDGLQHLRRRYGSRSPELLDLAAQMPSSNEALDPGRPEIRAEASFAAVAEMARRVEDVLRRRTDVALKAADGGAQAAKVTAELMAEQLEWNRAKQEHRAREYLDGHEEPESHWRQRA
ncbi:MAG: glycerol-3-phosphate dehydrogenase/oxidase [Candidatus Binatia bacterium]